VQSHIAVVETNGDTKPKEIQSEVDEGDHGAQKRRNDAFDSISDSAQKKKKDALRNPPAPLTGREQSHNADVETNGATKPKQIESAVDDDADSAQKKRADSFKIPPFHLRDEDPSGGADDETKHSEKHNPAIVEPHDSPKKFEGGSDSGLALIKRRADGFEGAAMVPGQGNVELDIDPKAIVPPEDGGVPEQPDLPGNDQVGDDTSDKGDKLSKKQDHARSEDNDNDTERKRFPIRDRYDVNRDSRSKFVWRHGLTETAGLGIMLGITAGIGLVAGVFYFGKRAVPTNREVADANTPLLGVDEFCEL
jgi:hypothetical protein